MSELDAKDLERLRATLDRLPGFDPEGLRLRWRTSLGAPHLLVLDLGDYGESSRRIWLVETPEHGGRERSTGRQWLEIDAADRRTADRLAVFVADQGGMRSGCTSPRIVWAGEDRWSIDAGLGALPLLGVPLGIVPDWTQLPDGSSYGHRRALLALALHFAAKGDS